MSDRDDDDWRDRRRQPALPETVRHFARQARQAIAEARARRQAAEATSDDDGRQEQ